MWLALADGLVAQGVCRFHRRWLALADTIAGAEQGISPGKAGNRGAGQGRQHPAPGKQLKFVQKSCLCTIHTLATVRLSDAIAESVVT